MTTTLRDAPIYLLSLPADDQTGLREPSQIMIDKIMAVRATAAAPRSATPATPLCSRSTGRSPSLSALQTPMSELLNNLQRVLPRNAGSPRYHATGGRWQ